MASAAPTVMSSNGSRVSAPSISLTLCDCISGCVACTISCSARVMRPRPIRMRPMRPTVVAWREMNSTTPAKISSGDSHERSNENTTAIRLVPTSAPSMIASAAGSEIMPCATKEDTISPVAALLCTSAVTPSPAAAALMRFCTLSERTRRSFAPSTRRMPVRTICVPHTSRAMAASRLSRCCIGCGGAPTRAVSTSWCW